MCVDFGYTYARCLPIYTTSPFSISIFASSNYRKKIFSQSTFCKISVLTTTSVGVDRIESLSNIWRCYRSWGNYCGGSRHCGHNNAIRVWKTDC